MTEHTDGLVEELEALYRELSAEQLRVQEAIQILKGNPTPIVQTVLRLPSRRPSTQARTGRTATVDDVLTRLATLTGAIAGAPQVPVSTWAVTVALDMGEFVVSEVQVFAMLRAAAKDDLVERMRTGWILTPTGRQNWMQYRAHELAHA